ncbi:MAG: phenylalanine--tRNA ligase subunit alpha, partial [Spirochaetaceae bacterium]|nr:phenylalanine--tRNA ligase subunit alpha [Spirochaetaceae bacterium]
MDVRSLVKTLHPLEVKVLLRYCSIDSLDAAKLQAELGYKEGHANQAFSWLKAKCLAEEIGRSARAVFELPPLGRELAAKGTPEERLLRRLSESGPARLPELAQALGLEQKDIGSAFGLLSKEGIVSMDSEKRAVVNAAWFAAAHAAAGAPAT